MDYLRKLKTLTTNYDKILKQLLCIRNTSYDAENASTVRR